MRLYYGILVITFSSLSFGAGVGNFSKDLATGFCEDQWTKRGELDQRMFNYCMRQQADGYDKALSLETKHSANGSKPVEMFDQVIQYALEKWAKPSEYQMNMVAYEMEQQVDGFLDVDYLVSEGKADAGSVNSCRSKWLPEWNMVAYCLEKQHKKLTIHPFSVVRGLVVNDAYKRRAVIMRVLLLLCIARCIAAFPVKADVELVCVGSSPQANGKVFGVDCDNREEVIGALSSAWMTLRSSSIGGTLENVCWESQQDAEDLHPALGMNSRLAARLLHRCNMGLKYVDL